MDIPPIISVDDHVMEPPHLWQRWLPAAHRAAGPRVVQLPWEMGPGVRQGFRPASSGPVTDFWVFGDVHQGIARTAVSVGLDADAVENVPIAYSEMRPGCYEVAARLADMDVIGVERSLCFPNVSRFSGQQFLWMKDRELALACVRAYNDWIVEEWSAESSGRLLPVCLVPLWDPHEAAAEVRRNAARGARAVAFSELPTLLGLPSIHDAGGYWIPFVEACDETSTVICIHIGSASAVATSSDDAPTAVRLSATSFNSQLCLSDWLFSGLLPRYPRLKLAFSESQVGWIPYVLERVDRIWRQGNAFAEIDPRITEPPSSYVADRIFGCLFEDDFGLRARNEVGIDQITFESDYPHQDTTWPDTLAYVERVMADLSDQERYKILRGNALRMLDLADDRGAGASRTHTRPPD